MGTLLSVPPTSELVLIGGKEESIRTWALDHPDHLGSDPGPAPHQPRDIGAVTCLQAPIFPAVKREEDYLPQVRREGACVISWTGAQCFTVTVLQFGLSYSQGFVTWGLEVHVPPEIMSKIVSLCLFPKRL